MSDDAQQRPTAEYGAPPVDGLQQFQSVKVVRAGEITEVLAGGCYVRERDGSTVFRQYAPKMTARYTPVEGDFWVVYPPDNYASISPRDKFLDGYLPVKASNTAAEQQPGVEQRQEPGQ